MKETNFKPLYLLLAVLVAVVGVQSYYLYDLKNSIKPQSELQKIEQNAAVVPFSDDFFNSFHTNTTDPFEQMKKMQEQMQKSFGHFNSFFSNDPFFQQAFSQMATMPLSDIQESKDSYVIELNIPGAQEQKIDIKTQGRSLIVHASSEKKKDQNDSNYIQRERYSQTFERIFTLPDNADLDNMSNDYKDGILTIKIPKKR